MTSVEAIQEEHRKIHKVQTLVDFAMHVLAHGDLMRADAVQLVDQVRARVLQIFPESADTFDLLYGRRFEQLVATCPELPPAHPAAVRKSRARHVH
jgi:hypothetical protein